eukprot:g14410.t1 g14410   contig9:1779362-1779764(+)
MATSAKLPVKKVVAVTSTIVSSYAYFYTDGTIDETFPAKRSTMLVTCSLGYLPRPVKRLYLRCNYKNGISN